MRTILLASISAVVITAAVSDWSVQAQPRDPLAGLRVPRGAVADILGDIESLIPQGDLPEQVSVMAERREIRTGPADNRAHVVLSFREPLTEEVRRELAERGVQIVDRLDEGLWIATVDTTGAAFVTQYSVVASADLYPPQAKLSEAIDPVNPFEWQKREDGRQAFSVLFHKGVTVAEVARLIESDLNAEFEDFDPDGFLYSRSLDVVISPDQLGELAGYDIVQWIEPEAPPNIDHNRNNTQPLSNVDDVQIAPYNLSGTGITVGVWENGDTIRATHRDLTPRVTVQAGQTASQDGHALHVAGTIGASGANDAAAEGMAPAANILSWDDVSDTNEMATAAAPGATPRIVASSHSYGAVIGWNGGAFTNNQGLFGRYNIRSVNFDTVVAGDGVTVTGTELIVVKSAGNDRNQGPGAPGQPLDCRQGGLAVAADCLGPVASAKNVITVGAMNGAGLIAGFSSFGPTDDGRIKPDLVAQGVGVRSLGNFGVPAGGGPPTDDIPQNDRGSWVAQGTSQATPAVTGIVALMFEEFANLALTPSAAAVKAILVQTAQDVAGTGQARVGPDYATGWGIADAQAAIDLLRRPGGPGYAEGTIAMTGAAGVWQYPFVVPAGQQELQITLAWSDLPGTPAGAGRELVNDLDLRLIPPGGGAARQPWTLNPANPGQAATRNGGDDNLNNVEQASVLNPAAGTWTARVTAKPGSLALGPQQFALAGPITTGEEIAAFLPAALSVILDQSGETITFLPAVVSLIVDEP